MDKNKTTKLKALFFGTSDRSIPILESLKDNFNLALCITKKDTKIGRKQEKKECGVKKWAKENNIEYLEIESLRVNLFFSNVAFLKLTKFIIFYKNKKP